MRKHICDICHRAEPYCQYTIKRKWKLLEHPRYPDETDHKMDICDDCFRYIISQRRKWREVDKK